MQDGELVEVGGYVDPDGGNNFWGVEVWTHLETGVSTSLPATATVAGTSTRIRDRSDQTDSTGDGGPVAVPRCFKTLRFHA